MPSHTWNSEVRGGYFKSGSDFTEEEKQQVADAAAQAAQAKLIELGASVPNDLEGVLPSG